MAHSFPPIQQRNPTLLSKNTSGLTRRQNQCLQLTAAGLTATVIARRLGISERMVRTHLRDARQRLNAHSTAEAVYLALKQNILE